MFWILFERPVGREYQATLWQTSVGGYEFAEFMAKVLKGTNLGGDISVKWDDLGNDTPLV
jgi:hypothetical protein